MKRIVLLLFLLFPSSASALEVVPSHKEITYGQYVQLTFLGGSGQLRLLAFSFPYEGSTVVGEWEGRKSIRVLPSRNTYYRLLRIENGAVVERSKPRIVWVQPQVRNRFRKNGPYLFLGGSLLWSGYFWNSYQSLRAAQRRIYLYQNCGRAWIRVRSFPLRGSLLEPNLFVSWQGSTEVRCRSWRTVGMFSMPRVGNDDGIGRPRLSITDAARASRLLGAARISRDAMAKYFPLS